MKLSIRHLLFGIAVFGAVVVAYTDRNQVDFGEHKRFDDQLNRLGEVDAALNQDVLKARFRMITNYDGIPGKLEELKRTVIALHDMPSFIPVARQEPIRHKLDELTQTFGAKEQLIEDFKSENAVVNNSLRYLPLASKRLIAALDSGTEGSLLKSRMESLIQQLLIYCLDSGENEERAIRQSLGELASWHTQHPDHAQAASVARVSAHVTSIVGRTPKVELLTQEIVALPTSQDAEQLGRLYDAELSKALHRADVIRWVFQGACLLSLLSVAYTIYELNSGNRLLEQRVKERTAALRETNQRFELVTTATTNVIWDWDLLQGTILWNENFQTVFGYSADTVGTGAESWTQRIHPDDVALTMRSIRAFIAGSDRLWSHEYRFRRHDGSYAFVFDRGFALRDEKGNALRMIGAMQDFTDRHRAEEALRDSERHYRDLIHWLPVALYTCDSEGRLTLFNESAARLWGREPELGRDRWCGSWKLFDLEGQTIALDASPMAIVMREGRIEEDWEIMIKRPDGSRAYVCSYPNLIRDAEGKVVGAINILVDLTERHHVAHEMEKLNRQLIETSRRAGMAEVATGVLHNVGNVLNSINVSSVCVADGVRKSKGPTLARIVAMLKDHESNLGSFFATDLRAMQLPAFLAQLADHLTRERTTTIKELEHLQKNVEHVKEIVSMQQEYAKVSGVTETVRIADLVEDTLRMNAESFSKHGLKVIREFGDVPSVTVEKHKVLQILVNLVRNATDACGESDRPEKTLTIRIFNGDGTVKVAVCDNGGGIPLENLTRIFNHGFTTKKDGHGFGLHSGALAAKGMGGAMKVESKGPGEGATFTLELPVKQKLDTSVKAKMKNGCEPSGT